MKTSCFFTEESSAEIFDIRLVIASAQSNSLSLFKPSNFLLQLLQTLSNSLKHLRDSLTASPLQKDSKF